MSKWTNNMSAIYDELKSGYDLETLRTIAKNVGLADSDLRPPKAKRASAKSAAYALATKVNPAKVRSELHKLGYPTELMKWDDFEPWTPPKGEEQQGEENVKSSGNAVTSVTAGENDGENEEPKDSMSEDEIKAFLAEIDKYFGTGQVKVLTEMLSRVEAKGGSSGTFDVRLPEKKEARELKGTPPPCFQRVLDMAQVRQPILMVGPPGCGKSHTGALLAEALDMPFSSISCTEGMSESQLLGWLLPIEDSGKFAYVPAEFVNRFEKGGVFLLDEIDASDPNVLLIMNTAVANGFLHIPQRHENPVARKHEDFILIAAANTYGNGADMQFVGRNPIDKATLDRFKAGTITMGYDDAVEQTLVHPDVLKWGRDMRKRIESASLEQFLSTRFMRDLSALYTLRPDEYGQAFWEEQLTQGWADDEISRIAA